MPVNAKPQKLANNLRFFTLVVFLLTSLSPLQCNIQTRSIFDVWLRLAAFRLRAFAV
jgi:hypothetical protein